MPDAVPPFAYVYRHSGRWTFIADNGLGELTLGPWYRAWRDAFNAAYDAVTGKRPVDPRLVIPVDTPEPKEARDA